MGKKQARRGSILPLPAATAYPTTTGTLAPLEEWLLLLGNIAVNIATILCRVRVQKGRESSSSGRERNEGPARVAECFREGERGDLLKIFRLSFSLSCSARKSKWRERQRAGTEAGPATRLFPTVYIRVLAGE